MYNGNIPFVLNEKGFRIDCGSFNENIAQLQLPCWKLESPAASA